MVFSSFVSSFATERVDGFSDSDQIIYELSEQVLQDLNGQHDTDLLKECMGFYIDNQQFDSPQGSYNKAIRLGYQIVNVDHKDIDTYTTMAWLLWSKWVSWTKNPNRMPDGEGKADQAVELLNWGKQWNLKSGRFYKESADTIWPLAKYYRADLYEFVIENYPGPTSHDVVDAIRHHFHLKKVGHCGTLDPGATGLLVIVLGRGTKLSEKLMADDKVYEGTF